MGLFIHEGERRVGKKDDLAEAGEWNIRLGCRFSLPKMMLVYPWAMDRTISLVRHFFLLTIMNLGFLSVLSKSHFRENVLC
jgi:hypothetical protein